MQTFFTLVCALLVIACHLTFELTDEKVYFQLISCKDDDDFTKSRRDLNALLLKKCQETVDYIDISEEGENIKST